MIQNIGYSCRLLSPQMPTLIVAGSSEEETSKALDKFVLMIADAIFVLGGGVGVLRIVNY